MESFLGRSPTSTRHGIRRAGGSFRRSTRRHKSAAKGVVATSGSIDTAYGSTLPPFKSRASELIAVKPGVWMITQELGFPGIKMDLSINMAVVALQDGNLWLCAPVAPTQQVLDMLAQLEAPVRHVVLPNTLPEHTAFASDLARCFPDATVWAMPGLLDQGDLRSLNQTHTCGELSDKPAPGWPAEIEVAVFKEQRGVINFSEAAFYLSHQRAAFIIDLLFGAYDRKAMPWDFMVSIAQSLGMYKQLGSVVGLVMPGFKGEDAARWVRRVTSWQFDTVLLGHLGPAVHAGPKDVGKAFPFLPGPLWDEDRDLAGGGVRSVSGH